MILVRFVLLLAAWLSPAFAQGDVQHVIPDAAAHQLGDSPFTVQGAIQMAGGLLALVAATLTIIGFISKRINRIEDAQDIRIKALEETAVEVKVKLEAFVPKGEIDQRFEHERNNRMAGDDAAVRAIQRHDDRIGSVQVDLGRLAEKVASMSNDMSEVKTLVKEQGRDHAIRFDKIQECLNVLSRRAA